MTDGQGADPADVAYAWRRRLRRWGLGLVGGVILAAAWSTYGPSADGLVEGVEWVRSAGAKGTLVFVVAYVIATFAMVPASWLMGASGFLYGPMWGLLLASTLSTVSGTGCFAVARLLLRKRLQHRITGRWAQVDRAVADGGLGLVVLLRLSPLSPYNLVNYGMGLTGVGWRDYVLGSWMGALVPIALWCVIGASVSDLGALLAGDVTGPVWARILGLGITLFATIAVTAFARRALDRALIKD